MNTQNKNTAQIIEAIKAIANSEQYKAKYSKVLSNGYPVKTEKARCA